MPCLPLTVSATYYLDCDKEGQGSIYRGIRLAAAFSIIILSKELT